MRILILNSKDSGGGAAAIARQVADGYVAAGHDVHWLVGTKTRKNDSTVSEFPLAGDQGIFGRAGIRLMKLAGQKGGEGRARLRWRRILQAANLRSTLAQRKGIEDFNLTNASRFADLLPWKPDIIHAHNLHSFNHHTHFDLRLLPQLTREHSLMVTLHDPWLLTGHCAHFIGCERWRTGCGECPDLHMYPPIRHDETATNWRTKKEIYQQSSLHVVGVCDWINRVTEASILKPALRSLRVIPNGLDLHEFRPANDRKELRRSLDIPDDALVISFASELGVRNPFRNFRAMQEASSTAARTLSPQKIVAVELGSESPQPRVQGNLDVRSPGFIPRPDVLCWLQATDVLLHAAVADTSPTIIYEAMACGIPVVATSVCGIPEQIVHGTTGLLVTPGDQAALNAALLQLLGSAGQRAQLGAAARLRMEKEFSLVTMVHRYLEAVDEIAASS